MTRAGDSVLPGGNLPVGANSFAKQAGGLPIDLTAGRKLSSPPAPLPEGEG
ncbi:hypothetical protein Pres01_36500 [Metapseudomonas resinovorans]|nr:hypothetical protein Pres01_36500 [Pseudomonas resinovorans]